MMGWNESVFDTCQRLSKESIIFTYSRLKLTELQTIVKETGSKGKTPARTLSRVLQKLRDEELIVFVDYQGSYCFSENVSELPKDFLKKRQSKGERKVQKALETLGVEFKPEKTFDDLRDKNHLRIDFYFELQEKKYAIEYDGIQHFQVVKYFGGEEGFKKRTYHDKMKDEYCEKNDIKLLRIPYTLFRTNFRKLIMKMVEEQEFNI